jgi:cobyrinic acid a,c-diamide synthase
VKSIKTKLNALCIAGTASGDGKTTVTLALMRALQNRGLKVQPFKCGPDYIDPTFHKHACGKPSVNLDCWMMGQKAVQETFYNASASADISVIEGVMGLYDASQPDTLVGSTAETAILLKLPVILVINAKGMAGSIAAMVKGYSEFTKDINIVGVIANRVGSEKHAEILKTALNAANLPPLLGFLPKNNDFCLPERHLGLVPFLENSKNEEWFNRLADNAEKYFELDKIASLTTNYHTINKSNKQNLKERKIKLGIAYDKAFHFYYPDNIQILKNAGFEIINFSPLKDKTIPDVDAIYIGGGFPEVFSKELEANIQMRQSLKDFADSNKTIYAECGGFMYLTQSITYNDTTYEMCNIIPAQTLMADRMRALGYRTAVTLQKTFLGFSGIELRGHEFHWSNVKYHHTPSHAWKTKRTSKNAKFTKCGYYNDNIFASYIHIHFASNPQVATNWYESCISSK